jgi:voltage-gated potassium channel Kch
VTRVEGVLTASVLDDAGVDDADLFVLTDLDEATAIPIVKDRNPDVRIVVYSHDSLPEFVRGQTDIAMDPDLFGVDMVAEELA